MIDILKQQFIPNMSLTDKLNHAREFLQILSLKFLSDTNAFDNIAFTGGTALRLLFNLRRFSEDMDFSLINSKGYDFKKLNNHLIRNFKLNGFNIESKPKTEKIVHNTFLKFQGLPKKLGLSNHANQNLSIKIEIDTNPPKGGSLARTILTKTYVFGIVHFDLPSMYATKLHACFYRKYTKGRDFYDFIWYIGKKIQPNYKLLNNAIKQTQGKSIELTEKNFQNFLIENIKRIDFKAARKDIERFLQDRTEIKLFDYQLIKDTIESTYSR